MTVRARAARITIAVERESRMVILKKAGRVEQGRCPSRPRSAAYLTSFPTFPEGRCPRSARRLPYGTTDSEHITCVNIMSLFLPRSTKPLEYEDQSRRLAWNFNAYGHYLPNPVPSGRRSGRATLVSAVHVYLLVLPCPIRP